MIVGCKRARSFSQWDLHLWWHEIVLYICKNFSVCVICARYTHFYARANACTRDNIYTRTQRNVEKGENSGYNEKNFENVVTSWFLNSHLYENIKNHRTLRKGVTS